MTCSFDTAPVALAEQDVAVMGHHSVHLERRAADGSQYITVLDNRVFPRETFRIVGNELLWDNQLRGRPTTYQIINNINAVIYEESTYPSLFNNTGWVDVAAPSAVGSYVARVWTKDNANPFSGARHAVDLLFEVTPDAPAAPQAPPGGSPIDIFRGITGDVTKLLLVGLGGILLIQGLGLVKAYSPRR